MALRVEDAKSTYLREGKGLLKGKYKRRRRVYVFACITCTVPIEVYANDLSVSLGRCKPCSDKSKASAMGRRNRKRPYEALFNSFANRRTTALDTLTYEEFVEFSAIKECHYCESLLVWSEYDLEGNGYGCNLDRKDSALGYSRSNCVACCWSCNRTKGNRFSYDQFVAVSSLLKRMRAVDEESELQSFELSREQFLAMNDFDFGE